MASGEAVAPNTHVDHAESAWKFYKETLGNPKFFCAPMVNQSELPFRLLTRKYNTHVAFTPMFHARIFSESKKYRASNFQTVESDRPLIVQFCGNDPSTLLAAAKLVEADCDAVDLNLGCPQGIARRGRYGSFLLGETELLVQIVSTLHKNLKIPVTCKIRLLPSLTDTLKLCVALEAAGCSMLTVHGRTKEEKHCLTRDCNWDAISRIKKLLHIPVVANGGISCINDINKCLHSTCVDGVMSSEALLENPSLFAQAVLLTPEKDRDKNGSHGIVFKPRHARQIQLAEEYMELARTHPTSRSNIRAHLNKFLYSIFVEFESDQDIQAARAQLNRAGKDGWFDTYLDVIASAKRIMQRESKIPCEEYANPTNIEQMADILHPGKWYVRHRDFQNKKRALDEGGQCQKRRKHEFRVHLFKQKDRPNIRSIMVFSILGLEDFVCKEIVEKIDDVNIDDIHTVGHYDFPNGQSADPVHVRKFVFQTEATLKVLQTLRTIDSIYAFVSAGDGVPVEKEPAMKSLKAAAFGTMEEGDRFSLFDAAVKTWRALNSAQTHHSVTKENLRFRIQCKKSGKHQYNTPDVMKVFAEELKQKKQWEFSMDGFDIEVCCLLMQSSFVIGIPLHDPVCLIGSLSMYQSSEALGETAVALNNSSTRPSMANLMCQLARAEPGDLVVDPMCGRGTIPIESTLMAGSFGVQHFSVGGDKQERCIQDCMCNISTASEAAQRYGCDALQWGFRGPLAKSSLKDSIDRRQSLSCDIIKWDAFRLPFRAGCVDAIVCDTPHDQNCKMKKHLVTPLWKELFRVLKVGGRAVLAIKFKNAFKKTIEKIDAPLSIERTIEVCVRGLVIHLFVVVKGGQ
jgi:tRNA-dihydrouridine synthase 1